MEIIGVGPTGWRVVRALREAPPDFTTVRAFCEATDFDDPDVARARTRDAVGQLPASPHDDERRIVLLVASLAEPVGAGATPVLAEALATDGVCVVPVVLTSEDLTARLALHCLSEHAASVVAIDPAFNGGAEAQLLAATLTASENGGLSVDPELKDWLYRQRGGYGRLARFGWASAPAESQLDRSLLTRRAFDALPARARDFAPAYLLRISGPGLRLRDLQECPEEILRRVGNDVDVAPSLSPNEGRVIEAGIIALGVDPPPT